MKINEIIKYNYYINLVKKVSIKIRRFLDAIKGEPHIPDEVIIKTARMFEVKVYD